MTSLIPTKSPHLLLRPIEQDFTYVVNCAYPQSLRLLTGPQAAILAAIDGQSTVSDLSERLTIPPTVLAEFLSLLAQTDIIRFDDRFSKPQKPTTPQSLNFWIHTTNRCNLACSYCYISTLHTTEGMSDGTKQQLLEKVVETVVKRKLTHIKFRLAGGEPLTQFKSWKVFIPQIRQRLQDVGCRFEASFITNLTILTDEIITFCKAQNIGFGISLDGLEDDNDASRPFKQGGGSFKHIDRNLRKLMAHQIPVMVNTVVNNQNLKGLPALTRYLIDLDVPFRYSIVKGEALDGDLLETNLLESYAIMEEAIQTGWSFTRRHQFCDLKPQELGFQTCASGFSGGAIYVDGTLNYCHVHFGDKTQSSHSIFDPELDLVDMIQQGSHEEDNRSADCKACRYSAVCTSGCPVYRVNGKDPQCSLYHRIIPVLYDLQAKERLKTLRDFKIL
ncbi:radical SAM/SPASM domain-containing protein [Spirosoma foliorum]|uniref:Radical SAM protein n=1 Tax=Spirosoma foliorum TaxID=2710596 RepID=A0A7G5H2R4_9BACT|nr:radical SAM protein [Spirosoma foliorum]QMW05406.1 radical SAM protein [Spirosoma foliorum]